MNVNKASFRVDSSSHSCITWIAGNFPRRTNDHPGLKGVMHLHTHQELLAPTADTPAPVRTFLQKYIEEFLCKPHPQLGRTGPVCPFMTPALRQNTVYYAIVDDLHVTAEWIDEVLANICARFLSLHPASGVLSSYKAVIILFPNLPVEQAPILIDGAQQRSKPSFVSKGLMLGEFHALNTTTGLRCPIGSAFCPLQTPFPALAIRSLVSSDIVFLDRPSFAPEIRASFLQSYYSRFPKESDPSSTPAPIDEPRLSSPTSQSMLFSRPTSPKSSVTAYFFLLIIGLLSAYCWLRSHLVLPL